MADAHRRNVPPVDDDSGVTWLFGMFRSFPLMRLRGIPITAHASLLLAFVLLVFEFGLLGLPIGVLLFGSVLLHELGHAFVAQNLGIRIAGIELHLLGGAALMTEQPDEPNDEILIAAAGPAVSFVLGGSAFLLSWILDGALVAGSFRPGDLFAYAAAINFGLALFNLIPALPMDGGRIFRALLSRRMGAFRATRLATHVARVLAIGFGLFGLATMNLSLILIGGFVFLLAGRERRVAELKEARRLAASRIGDWWTDHPAREPLTIFAERVVEIRRRG